MRSMEDTVEPCSRTSFALSRLTRTEPAFHVADTVQIQPGEDENNSKVEDNESPDDPLMDVRLIWHSEG